MTSVKFPLPPIALIWSELILNFMHPLLFLEPPRLHTSFMDGPLYRQFCLMKICLTCRMTFSWPCIRWPYKRSLLCKAVIFHPPGQFFNRWRIYGRHSLQGCQSNSRFCNLLRQFGVSAHQVVEHSKKKSPNRYIRLTSPPRTTCCQKSGN